MLTVVAFLVTTPNLVFAGQILNTAQDTAEYCMGLQHALSKILLVLP